MAPTVCSKKEPNMRDASGGSVIVARDTKKVQKNSTYSSSSTTAAVNNVGKIIHRRSATVRSARSRLSARRLPASGSSSSSSSEESDVEDYRPMNADDSIPSSSNKFDDAFPSITNHPVADATMDMAPSPATTSETSFDCQCSDRLTTLTGTSDSAYDSIRCRHCGSSNSASPASSFDENDAKPVVSNDIVVFNPARNEPSDDCASDYSTNSSSPSWYSEECSTSHLDNSKFYVSKKTPKNNRALLEIAVKTVKLIRRNQLLQQKLAQLQLETRQFFESVMANPENQNIQRMKIEA